MGRLMQMEDGTLAHIGDLVRGEPPRGAAATDRGGARWWRLDRDWVSRDRDACLSWPLLRDLYGPMRLSR
jgi:hypothetical protein